METTGMVNSAPLPSATSPTTSGGEPTTTETDAVKNSTSVPGVLFLPTFLPSHAELFEKLRTSVAWDERMLARKTASFGKAYNYGHMSYDFQEFTPELDKINKMVKELLQWEPNNCLINYYLDGKSKMGFHSDQTDNLEEGSGVVIISLGETRTLRFRNIEDKECVIDYALPSGSLICMSQAVQDNWHHAIPKSDTEEGRMSLTLRRMK